MTALPVFQSWSASWLQKIEQSLSDWVPEDTPADLGQAMRYAVLDGGKRVRALLVLASCEAVQGDTVAALRAACAVELVHAYSLVHDDMPCMDNDVLRRGKPTVHVKFGQAQALLAGDALQALAFELLCPDDSSIPALVQARWCRLLARAAGHCGMAGGQAIDLAHVGQGMTPEQLRAMHELKTGALLQASVEMGSACTSTLSERVYTSLRDYGRALGLAFQVVDDILDVTADATQLGKTAGKDAVHDKPTYVSVLGLKAAQEHADQLLGQAHAALAQSGLSHVHALHGIADWVVRRTY